MRKNVHERYRSVVELAQDIDNFLRGEPLKARPDSLTYSLGKFLRRNRRAVLALVTVLALVAVLIVFYTVRLAKARDAALVQTARTQHIQRFMLGIFGGDPNAAPAGDLRLVDILDRGVREAEFLKGEPAIQADLYTTLGGIYHSLGKLDRADSLLESALERRRSTLGSNNPDVAESLLTLALLRIDQAQFAEAERLARESVAIDKSQLPRDDPKLGQAMCVLGSVLEHRGAYREAIEVLEGAVRIASTPEGRATRPCRRPDVSFEHAALPRP